MKGIVHLLALVVFVVCTVISLMLGQRFYLDYTASQNSPLRSDAAGVYLHMVDAATGAERPSQLPIGWRNGTLIRLNYGRLTHYVPPPLAGDANVDLEPGVYKVAAGWMADNTCHLFVGQFTVQDAPAQRIDLPTKVVPCEQYPQ